MKPYLRPTAPIATDVLLPADPGVAMELAQRVLAKPLMANHHHGLWGYSGLTEAGRELTVQASGIGGPSAAAVVAELAAHGARRVIRIGECEALDGSLDAAEQLVATSARGADGTSLALGAGEARPDPELTERLAAAGRGAAIASHDLGTEAGQAVREGWTAAGIVAVDLETAAVFAMAERLGVAAAAALVVAEADEEAVREGMLEAGDLAAAALAAPAPVTNVD